MNAVWSLWSKPLRHQRWGWASELHHLLSWVVSVETARKHFVRTALYTDDDGARALIDGLGLEFDHVSTRLNQLAGHDPDWWALGKVLTYSLQEEPFVHIDSDVYLWSPLPARLTAADVLAQNPEAFNAYDLYYGLDGVRARIAAARGWLPGEMEAYMEREGVPRAACCGIVGGRRVDFLRHYARQAIRFLDHPANRPAWRAWPDRSSLNIVFEQHLLIACLDYHAGRPDSAYAGVRIEHLFTDFGDAFRRAPEAGFTHLLGSGAKRDPEVLARLEARVRRDHPGHYERCVRYCSGPRHARPLPLVGAATYE